MLSSATGTLRLLNLALALVLFAALWRNGNRSLRPFFTYYVGFHLLRGVALAIVPFRSTAYGWVYLSTEPLVWLFYVLIVVELYAGALRNYLGIVALSRWVLSLVIAAAVAVSLVSLAPDLNSDHPFPVIHAVTAIGRALCTSLALFLLGTTLFFLAYPIPLSRNTIIHSAVCSTYFVTHAAAYFAHNVAGPTSWALVNFALVLLTTVSLLGWLIFLRPEGEQIIVQHRPQWSPEAEEQMLARLNALNGMLVRSIRK